MADQNNGAFLAGKLQGLEVHFGHQRARGVNHFQGARFGFIAHGRRNAVGAKNQHRAMRHFFDGFHENRAAPAQLLHNISVMDDLMVDVDRRAVGFQRQFDDIDGAYHTGTETARPHPQ